MRSTYLLFLFLFIFVCLPKSHVSLVFYLSSPIYLISTFFSSLSLFSSRVAQNGCWSFLRIKHIQVEHCEWSAQSCPKPDSVIRWRNKKFGRFFKQIAQNTCNNFYLKGHFLEIFKDFRILTSSYNLRLKIDVLN